VPLYWKQLADVNPVELVAHRHVWSLVLLLVLVALQGRRTELRGGLGSAEAVGRNLLSSAPVSSTANWLVYVWGVNTGHVIETSLGYFLVPLVNVALGRFVLHERLRPVQWAAIAGRRGRGSRSWWPNCIARRGSPSPWPPPGAATG
jgi:chloramphenicol-sensitive protein RarD